MSVAGRHPLNAHRARLRDLGREALAGLKPGPLGGQGGRGEAATTDCKMLRVLRAGERPRPGTLQRQAVLPVLQAATLDRQEQTRLSQQQTQVQRQINALGKVTPGPRPAEPLTAPATPTTPGDWVTVMRLRVEEVGGRHMDARSSSQFTALQRQVAQTLSQGFLSDRSDTQARYATYGEHLATLQRSAVSAPVSRVVVGLIRTAVCFANNPELHRPCRLHVRNPPLSHSAEQLYESLRSDPAGFAAHSIGIRMIRQASQESGSCSSHMYYSRACGPDELVGVTGSALRTPRCAGH